MPVKQCCLPWQAVEGTGLTGMLPAGGGALQSLGPAWAASRGGQGSLSNFQAHNCFQEGRKGADQNWLWSEQLTEQSGSKGGETGSASVWGAQHTSREEWDGRYPACG